MYPLLHILHLVSLFLLVGVTFAAFAAPEAENRKRYLMFSGIASLLAFISGFGLLHAIKAGFPLWVIVKMLCWLFISGVCGMAFRKRESIKTLVIATSLVIALAVCMVSLKPF